MNEHQNKANDSYAVRFQDVSKRYRLRTARTLSLRHALPEMLKGAARRLVGRAAPREDFWALRDISFTVNTGEVLGIIGPNGAGKSTALKLLSHVTEPTTGTIDVHGKVAALIEIGAGFHPELSGRENIFLNAAILGLRRAEARRRFDDIVRFAELERFIDTPVKRYSSGMYARLGFAVAAHVDADVLLVDEVLSVGDANFQVKCFNRMHEIRRSGKTIVIVSHNLSNIKKYCDRALLLLCGQIATEGNVDHVVAEYHRHLRRLNEHSGRLDAAGSGSLRITAAHLVNADGQPCSEFQTGEQAGLLLDYDAAEPIGQAIFGVSIRAADGTYITGLTTKLRGDVLRNVHGHGRVAFRFDPISLFEGTYSLTLWAKNAATGTVEDYHFAACHLAVTGPPADRGEFAGYVCLPHRWYHNGHPVGDCAEAPWTAPQPAPPVEPPPVATPPQVELVASKESVAS